VLPMDIWAVRHEGLGPDGARLPVCNRAAVARPSALRTHLDMVLCRSSLRSRATTKSSRSDSAGLRYPCLHRSSQGYCGISRDGETQHGVTDQGAESEWVMPNGFLRITVEMMGTVTARINHLLCWRDFSRKKVTCCRLE
jgi:hypothetical protein